MRVPSARRRGDAARPGDPGADAAAAPRIQGQLELQVVLVLGEDESARQYLWRSLGLRVVDHPTFYGVRVDAVDPGGAAARVPVREGDLIDALDGRPVDSADDLFDLLRRKPGGASVLLQGFRADRGFRGTVVLPVTL